MDANKNALEFTKKTFSTFEVGRNWVKNVPQSLRKMGVLWPMFGAGVPVGLWPQECLFPF